MAIQYPYLPLGRAFQYVSEDDPFMAEAKRMRDEHSTDALVPIGAVLVLNGVILGRAANQSVLRSKKLIAFHREAFCVRRFLRIPTGTYYWLCPGCASHRHHAESRAVKDALRSQVSVEGSSVYLYGHWWCCKPCWDAMIAAGIKNVYLLEGSEKLFKQ